MAEQLLTSPPSVSPEGAASPRKRVAGRRLSPRLRRLVLTVHIAASVALLGDSAAFLAVAVRGATTDDPALARACWELLAMFSAVFGIPLSVVALSSGLVLGLGSKWGVLRHPWVAIKLVLLLSVMLAGALLLGRGVGELRQGGGSELVVVAGAGWDVLALLVATALSVYKPGRARRRRAR